MKKCLPLNDVTISEDKTKLRFNSFLQCTTPVGLYGFRPGSLKVKFGAVSVNVDGSRYFLRAGHSGRLVWTDPCLISVSSEQGAEIEITFYEQPLPYSARDVVFGGQKSLQQSLTSALLRVREFMITHADKNISLDALAEHAYLSQNYLVRTFKKKYGLPPFTFLRVIRCYLALEKLIYQNMKSVDVAMDGSFCDQSHFIRAFKMTFGVTPKALMKMCRTVDMEEHRFYRPQYAQEGVASLIS